MNVFDPQQFKMQRGDPCKSLQELKGIPMPHRGIESNDQFRMMRRHAEQIVTIVAADIGNPFALH